MLKTVAQHLSAARSALIAADIDGSALDARLLLQAATGFSHDEIIAEPDAVVPANQSAKFQEYLKRRLAHEPVSRILGRREFYGREFLVSPAVLDPRADTETVVELALDPCFRRDDELRVLDIGTGSGAIIITLLAERPHATGLAIDLSPDALHIAKKNALQNGVSGRLQFQHSSWFENVIGKFDLIISNPPYIPHSEIAELEADVKDYDPHLALDGGGDGLFAYRAIAAGALKHLAEGGFIVVEIGAGQADDVTAIFAQHRFELIEKRADLGGLVRGLAFRLVKKAL
jgi:release factor glutamine methyltransferase